MTSDTLGRPLVSSRSLVLTIIVVAALLTAAAVSYSGSASASVQRSAVAATNSNAQIEVHDLANILSSRLVAISDNLRLLSQSHPAMALNASGVSPLLVAAQGTTSNYTTAYSLIDQRGRPVASNNETALAVAISQGNDNFSSSDFFVGAKVAGTTFTDPEYYSVSANKTFIVISQPVYSSAGGARTFVGVLTSGVSFSSLGRLIAGQLAPQAQGSLGVVDYRGTVLYGNTGSNEGKNLFSPQIRAAVETALPGQGTTQFYGFINDSLSGSSALSDFEFNGLTIALASAPVTYGQILGNQLDQRLFAAVYVSAPSTLAAGQAGEISQLQTFTGVTIAGIVGIASVSSYVIVRRNRALGELVNARTADLEKSLKTSELMQDILTHDIRNYNQASLANIELLKEELAGGDGSFDRAESIARANSALKAIEGSTTLVEKAKTLGRIVSDREVRLRPMDLEDSLKSAMEVVVQANPGKSVKMTPQIPSGSMVLADELLVEAFANLISNSVRYTQGNDVPIEVSAETDVQAGGAGPKDGYWKVTIVDRGRGIEGELKADLFARYLKSAHGSGLGLSIVYALVTERYAGRLRVTDRVEGDHTRGTKVEVWLPKAP